jgi:small subunit ribosomal protein S17
MAEENVETETAAAEAANEQEAATPAAQPEVVAEPQKPLTPAERKAQKRAARIAKTGARPARTVAERQAERDALRAKKAAARRLRRGQEREAYKASGAQRQVTPPRERVVGVKKTRQGVVVSDKAAKTITVRIDVARRHHLYEKVVRTVTTIHAHDEHGEAHVGDTVVVTESRPLSATKRWRLIQVVERAR